LRHMVTEDVRVVHMEHVKPYFSDSLDAYSAALVDQSQYVVDSLLAWQCDPERRSTMSFLVRFLDGDEIWLPYSKDLAESGPFTFYCRANAPLMPLLHTEKAWWVIAAARNKETISVVNPGTHCWVDLRAWGAIWFRDLDLPAAEKIIYVVFCKYLKWDNEKKTHILMSCPLFRQLFVWKNTDIEQYGLVTLLGEGMQAVDEDFVGRYPQVMRDILQV
jgi:hypothetical protein